MSAGSYVGAGYGGVSVEVQHRRAVGRIHQCPHVGAGVQAVADRQAGAYTRPLFSST